MTSKNVNVRFLSRTADVESALRLRLAHLKNFPDDPRRRVVERHARYLRHRLLAHTTQRSDLNFSGKQGDS